MSFPLGKLDCHDCDGVLISILGSDCRMRPPSCILWSWNWLGKIRHREKSKWGSTPSVVFGGKSWGLHALTNKRNIAAATDKRLINGLFGRRESNLYIVMTEAIGPCAGCASPAHDGQPR